MLIFHYGHKIIITPAGRGFNYEVVSKFGNAIISGFDLYAPNEQAVLDSLKPRVVAECKKIVPPQYPDLSKDGWL